MKLPQTFYVIWNKLVGWTKGLSLTRKRLIVLGAVTMLCFLTIWPFLPKGQSASKSTVSNSQEPAAVVEAQPKVSKASTQTTNPTPVKPQVTAKSLGTPVNGKTLRGTSKDAIWWQVFQDYRQHTGVDILAIQGNKVLAAGAGTVSEFGTDPAYGKVIVIDHGTGLKTVYGQLDQLKVKLHDPIRAGQVLGVVGKPVGGEADLEPHLHYEIRENGKILN